MMHKALPVTLPQFERAFETLCPRTAAIRVHADRRIGLAISGGVDSMALAHLCSLLQKHKRDEDFLRFRALIVDHQAREGSAVEASKVVKLLRKMGIPSTRLKLDWRSFTNNPPSTLPNFETIARRLRYQALGRACRHFRMRSLLVAHHEDDQAETVLVRILNGYTGPGLRGMRPRRPIPECEAIYGVHASGFARNLAATGTPRISSLNPRIQGAYGGVEVKRPLLGFNKARLIATCHGANVAWFEDVTNELVTLTPRNSVRSVLREERLPAALGSRRLLALANEKQRQSAEHLEEVDNVFRKLSITFDPRIGALSFVVPDGLFPSCREIALDVLERLAYWVSPGGFGKSQLSRVCSTVFPLFDMDADESTKQLDELRITAAQILWQHKRHASNSTWHLSRQPFSSSGFLPSCTWASTSQDTNNQPFWTWQLWDGRFWLRVHDRYRPSIVARPMEAKGLSNFRKQLTRSERQRLDTTLKQAAPSTLRWTIPALSESFDGDIVALPTLGIVLSSCIRSLQWQVLFKNTKP